MSQVSGVIDSASRRERGGFRGYLFDPSSLLSGVRGLQTPVPLRHELGDVYATGALDPARSWLATREAASRYPTLPLRIPLGYAARRRRPLHCANRAGNATPRKPFEQEFSAAVERFATEGRRLAQRVVGVRPSGSRKTARSGALRGGLIEGHTDVRQTRLPIVGKWDGRITRTRRDHPSGSKRSAVFPV
jgi:hypothetical protein